MHPISQPPTKAHHIAHSPTQPLLHQPPANRPHSSSCPLRNSPVPSTMSPPSRAPQHAAAPPPVDVSFTDLSYHIPQKHSVASRLRLAAPLPSKQILHSISAYVGAAQSLAILGPSGSGKTTLLNLLAGRSDFPPSSGTLLFAGKPRVARTKRHIGYVMQDDVFFSKLTVKETLHFTASIRVPHLSRQRRDQIVHSIMRKLRLLKCQHTIIGDQQFEKGISGGERKRLNIANELLHNPSLLLADECTSGLDSSSAYTVISMLRDLCLDGRTVITTIHQPSSQIFALFDNIMVLAAGHVAYFGPAATLVSYFESVGFPLRSQSYNPADFVLELVIDDVPPEDDEQVPQPAESRPLSSQQKVIDAWNRHGTPIMEHTIAQSRALSKKRTTPLSHLSLPMCSSDDQSTESAGESSSSHIKLPVMHDHPDAPSTALGRMRRAVVKRFHDVTMRHTQHNTPDKYPTDWFTQVRVLAVRAFRQKRGNVVEPMYVIHVSLITLVVSMFWLRMRPVESTIEDRLGALSFVCIFFAFFSTFNAMYAFPAEKQVLNKDRASGAYRLSAYYFAKSMVSCTLCIFCRLPCHVISLSAMTYGTAIETASRSSVFTLD